jgi:hypothetical protein
MRTVTRKERRKLVVSANFTGGAGQPKTTFETACLFVSEPSPAVNPT